MLIPLGFIRGVIKERGNYREKAYESITNSWGKAQLIIPPVLVVPVEAQVEKNRKLITKTWYAHFPPDNLEIKRDCRSLVLTAS